MKKSFVNQWTNYSNQCLYCTQELLCKSSISSNPWQLWTSIRRTLWKSCPTVLNKSIEFRRIDSTLSIKRNNRSSKRKTYFSFLLFCVLLSTIDDQLIVHKCTGEIYSNLKIHKFKGILGSFMKIYYYIFQSRIQ